MTTTTRCAAIVVAGLMAACASSPATPSATTPAMNTEIFAGHLDPGGSRFYSFSTSSGGVVSVTLASLTTGSAVGTASAVAVGVGVGTPAGTDCGLASSIEASAGLSAHLTLERWAGTHCVRVHDTGQLESAVNFAIRIVHP